MRRPGPALTAVLGLALALSGCTGSDEPPRPRDEAARSPEQADRIARAGLLTAADVPGLSDRPVPGVAQAAAQQLSETLATCLDPDPAAQRQVVGVESPVFSAQSGLAAQAATSWAGVFPDALAAGADVRRSAEPTTVECLRRGFEQVLAAQTPPGVTVSKLAVSPLDLSTVTGASESFGYRFTAAVRAGSVSTQLQGQFVGAAVGDAAVVVYSLVLGEPRSRVTAARLLPELVGRAGAAQRS